MNMDRWGWAITCSSTHMHGGVASIASIALSIPPSRFTSFLFLLLFNSTSLYDCLRCLLLLQEALSLFLGGGHWDILLAVQDSPPPQLPEVNYSPEVWSFCFISLRERDIYIYIYRAQRISSFHLHCNIVFYKLTDIIGSKACDFVACMLQHDPSKRQTAKQLLTHPFIKKHK